MGAAFVPWLEPHLEGAGASALSAGLGSRGAGFGGGSRYPPMMNRWMSWFSMNTKKHRNSAMPAMLT